MTVLAALAAATTLAVPASPAASTDTAATRHAICVVFGAWCSQAIRVATCESTLNVYARSRSGHWGLFQFGAYARARYGFAWDAWSQSRAAFRYFAASGYRWTAWSCKP